MRDANQELDSLFNYLTEAPLGTSKTDYLLPVTTLSLTANQLSYKGKQVDCVKMVTYVCDKAHLRQRESIQATRVILQFIDKSQSVLQFTKPTLTNQFIVYGLLHDHGGVKEELNAHDH